MKHLAFIFTIAGSLAWSACSEVGQKDTQGFSFVVAGHPTSWYGHGLNDDLEMMIPYIKGREEIEFLIIAGDVVQPESSVEDLIEVDKELHELGLPVYRAFGNHDMELCELMAERYGPPYYSFRKESELFLVLDTDQDGWNISGPQLDWLKMELMNVGEETRRVFVITHQLIWREQHNRFRFLRPNSNEGRADSVNYWTEIEPLLASTGKPIMLIAGDQGGGWWASDGGFIADSNFTYIATGMGDNIGDNFLVINVLENGSLEVEFLGLHEALFDWHPKMKARWPEMTTIKID